MAQKARRAPRGRAPGEAARPTPPRAAAPRKRPTTVRDVMTRDPVTARIPGKRTDVLRALVKHKLTGVPVVRPDGTLAGFVARKHLFANPDVEQLAMVMVRDYPSIDADAPLRDLAHLLVEQDLHHLPVVSKGKVVGIVTPADLMDPIANLGFDQPVEGIVRTPCVAVHEGTPVNVASEIMRLGKVFALPVLDDGAHLVGILTDRDIFQRSAIDKKAAALELGLAGDEDAWTWEGLRNVIRLAWVEHKLQLPRTPLREIMVRKPVTVFQKTGVSEAARLMDRHDFGQLPIVDARDGLYAMLYELDVVTVLA